MSVTTLCKCGIIIYSVIVLGVLVYNVYGWQDTNEGRGQTDALLKASLDDVAGRGSLPALLCGDFNAGLSSLPSFAWLADEAL